MPFFDNLVERGGHFRFLKPAQVVEFRAQIDILRDIVTARDVAQYDGRHAGNEYPVNAASGAEGFDRLEHGFDRAFAIQ